MTYCSNIKGIEEFINICVQKGMEHMVISPGSRNAPLTISFARNKHIKTSVIVDERSAAFFALGIAQQTGKTVGLLCTSGSALLNYAPAIAEAYYQGIPLMVVSADRPAEWINQDDSQAINQKNVFSNFIKASYNLPSYFVNTEEESYFNRMCNEAFIKIYQHKIGPVHVNFPLREPLYDFKPVGNKQERIIKQFNSPEGISEDNINYINSILNSTKKILVLASLYVYSSELNSMLVKLSKNKNIVILSETVSNISGGEIITCVDKLISSIHEYELETFKPDLLINFGGALVSKMVKSFLRTNRIKEHWHIGVNDDIVDTFMCLSVHVNIRPETFFAKILPEIKNVDSEFKQIWKAREKQVDIKHRQYIDNLNWSDMQAFDTILASVPEQTNLHLANSSVVRYAQLFKTTKQWYINANRGVSGIDGCTSTALGAAYVNNKMTCVISGDLSFFYDSNALWNKYIGSNFRVVVVNNGGGGIFRFIPGPSKVDELEEYFEHEQNINIDKIAETFGLDYLRANNNSELKTVLTDFYDNNGKAKILEIITPRVYNSEALKNYFKSLKTI